MELKLDLPIKVQKAKSVNPKKLFIFSHTKAGKTKACSLLPNNLIIDLEDGSNFCDGMFINVKKVASDNNISVLHALKEVSKQLKASEHKYDYVTIDTSSALEQYAEMLATILYKKTPQGKNYSGNSVVTDLANGGGYQFLRQAFEEIYSLFDGIAKECLIILGHTKLASVNKDGREIQVRDVNLTGKIKIGISAEVDAIGTLYRDPKNPNITTISFKTDDLNIATGARPDHLKQNEFALVEFDPKTNTFKSNWDKIFLKN